jgi:hypothetical protein
VRAAASLVAVVGLLALPGSASAANLYVDNDTGDDANPGCPQSDPCKSIENALSESDPNDTIFVDGGEYNDPIVVGDGISLIAQDFVGSPEGETVTDSVLAMQPAIRVAAGDPAGTIEGFTIRSDYAPVMLDAAATLRKNIFDEPDEPTQTGADVWVSAGAGSPTIDDNIFSDSTTTDDQVGIHTFSIASPVIRDNELTGFATGIDAQRGTPQILGNDVSDFHSESFSGIGIEVRPEGNATIEENVVHDPAGDNPGPGIFVAENSAPGGSGATLKRNRVIGPGAGATGSGVAVTDAAGPVTLDGDVIAHYDHGIAAGDNGGDGGGDVSLHNVTVVDNLSFEIFANETHVTLDSSIVGAGGIGSVLGTGTCSMTFTNLVPGGTPLDSATCGPGAFQHNLDPMFVDAAAMNYHLQPGSPMVDAGNPAPPAPGATDPDGNARALDGDKNCVARRDIGADERVPAPPPPDCSPAQPPADTNPPETEITKGPKRKSKKRKAKFEFSADEPASTFECALDKKPLEPCSSPKKYRELKRRRHRFQVRSIDPAGNADQTPDLHKFKIKKKPRVKRSSRTRGALQRSLQS